LSLILERQSGKLRGQQTVSMQGVVSPMTTDAAKAMHGESSFQQKAAPIYPRQQSQEQTQRTANDVSAVAGLDVKAESEASPSSVLIVDDNPINRQVTRSIAVDHYSAHTPIAPCHIRSKAKSAVRHRKQRPGSSQCLSRHAW